MDFKPPITITIWVGKIRELLKKANKKMLLQDPQSTAMHRSFPVRNFLS
jgi:hypothetical protein